MMVAAKNVPDKSVLVLSTGGTLGMSAKSDQGSLEPAEVLKDLLTWIPELEEFAQITVEILENIDSSLLEPPLWLTLAQRIEKAQDERSHDGIVILHGTDTLAFSSSALSFLLPNLKVPVVLTGSQKPLAVTRTDARNNILGAVESALEGPAEVMVFFDNLAFRGNRVTKTAIADFHAFHSPNFGPLGRAGIHWSWNTELFWPDSKKPALPPALPEELPAPPLVIPWVPGFRFDWLAPALVNQWAIILEAFGTGNLPVLPHTMEALRSFSDGGGLILIKSQVPCGGVMLDQYAPGAVLKQLPVIACADMTREAAVTKLMVLKAMKCSNRKIAALVASSLAGELG